MERLSFLRQKKKDKLEKMCLNNQFKEYVDINYGKSKKMQFLRLRHPYW